MWEAAPAPWRAAFRFVIAITIVLAAASTAQAAATPSLYGTLRGAAIRPADLLRGDTVSVLADHGVNLVLLDRSTSSQGGLQKMDTLAKRLRLHPVTYSSRPAPLTKTCGPRRHSVIWRCARLVPSLNAGLWLARRGGMAIVKTSAATLLRTQRPVGPGRVIFLVPAPQVAASLLQLRKVIVARKLDIAVSLAVPLSASLTSTSVSVFSSPLGTANLWIDTNRGTCTRSATPVAYNDATSCNAMSTAYAAALPGDSVLVKAGTYAYGAFPDDPSKDGNVARVTIQAAPDESVTWGNGTPHGTACASGSNNDNIDICGQNVTFADMRFQTPGLAGGIHVWDSAANVTFLNIKMGNGLYINGAPNFRMIGGQVGPANSNGGSGDGVVLACAASAANMTCDGSTLAKTRPSAIFDGVTFTHINKTVDMSAHTDCLQTTSFASLAIINSTFTACADAPIILGGENNGGQASTLLVQNNFIRANAPASTQGITMDSDYVGSLVIQYNTFDGGGLNIGSPVTFRGNAVTNNFSASACSQLTNAGATLTYNVWGSGSLQCGATNFVSRRSFGFVNDSADPTNLHVGPSSPLVGRGDPAHHPATDIDGAPRPSLRAPDAGADQAGKVIARSHAGKG